MEGEKRPPNSGEKKYALMCVFSHLRKPDSVHRISAALDHLSGTTIADRLKRWATAEGLAPFFHHTHPNLHQREFSHDSLITESRPPEADFSPFSMEKPRMHPQVFSCLVLSLWQGSYAALSRDTVAVSNSSSKKCPDFPHSRFERERDPFGGSVS